MNRRAQPWLGTLVEITIADSLDEAELISCFNDAFARVDDPGEPDSGGKIFRELLRDLFLGVGLA